MSEPACCVLPCPPQVAFGLAELRRQNGPAAERLLVCPDLASSAQVAARLGLAAPRHGTPQSYALRFLPDCTVVLAAEAVGAMYGLLELADAWRDGVQGGLVDCDRQPHIAQRGIKFNLPLDLRTPSYSDTGEAAQLNIPTIWEVGFWRDFLDEMARDRFNVLTLWNLHPFPSLVRVPEYPEVALDDVWRTTLPFDTTFSLCGEDMLRPAMLEQHEVVKRIGIDGKIAFWRSVMQQAHERGIAVYIFTWNIFTYGAEGKHGITCDQENPVTLDYFRRSVRELVLTYPLLAGIGLTAGKNMREGSSVAEREIWLRRAYGEGVADALSLQPWRSVRIIHRAHQTSFTEIHEA